MRFLQNQKGLTLVELLIASLIMGIMAIFIGTFLIESFTHNLEIEAAGDLGNFSQQTVNRMRLELSQSRRLFDQSEGGHSYWEALHLPKGLQPSSGSRLPEIVPHGSLSPSNSENYRNPFVRDSVGNILFFAQHESAMQTLREKTMVDLYHFVAYFLVERREARFSPKIPMYLDLMRCESGLYADLGQLRDIRDDETRSKALKTLQANGVLALWDVGQSADVAFTELVDYKPGKAPLVKPAIEMKNCVQAISSLGYRDRLSGPMTYSVAFNGGAQFNIRRQVPLFAGTPTAASAASLAPGEMRFPNGFEIVMVGPKSGRQVYLRLVLAANIRRSITTRDASIIATVKDS